MAARAEVHGSTEIGTATIAAKAAQSQRRGSAFSADREEDEIVLLLRGRTL
jgi:hypothetical protein